MTIVNRNAWAVLMIVAGSIANASAETWPRFRGHNGAGVSDAKTVPIQWSDDDYNWRVELPGVGHSSPVVWNDRLFVTCGDEATGQRSVMCLNTSDGSRRWLRNFDAAPNRKHKLNSFASATPALDRQRVYVCWGTPDEFVVLALDHDGRDVWRRDLGAFQSGHGDGVSPIVHAGLVVVPMQHNGESRLIGLNCGSGETLWQVPCEPETAWSTPCLLHRGEQTELIFTNWKHGILAVDPKSGRVLWQSDVFDKGHVEASISSPIVAGNLVIGTSGYLGVRKEVIAVRPVDDGNSVKAEQIYCIDRNAPLCVTPLVYKDLLFVWSDEGVVTCADVTTGDVHWRKRVGGSYYSSPICIDENVYNISTDGEVVVFKAAREYQELARNQLGQPSQATPAVADGVLYLRTLSHIYSLGKKSVIVPRSSP